MVKACLQGASALFGIGAAGLWWYASYQTVPANLKPVNDWVEANLGGEIDFVATAKEQTKWNARAALITGIAAALQAASLLVT